MVSRSIEPCRSDDTDAIAFLTVIKFGESSREYVLLHEESA